MLRRLRRWAARQRRPTGNEFRARSAAVLKASRSKIVSNRVTRRSQDLLVCYTAATGLRHSRAPFKRSAEDCASYRTSVPREARLLEDGAEFLGEVRPGEERLQAIKFGVLTVERLQFIQPVGGDVAHSGDAVLGEL